MILILVLTYIGTDLSSIEEKQKSGEMTGIEVRDAVHASRVINVSKMFI